MRIVYCGSELYHHGIKGQKWGIRKYQNPDGTLTAEGRKRYGVNTVGEYRKKVAKKVAIGVLATGAAVAAAYGTVKLKNLAVDYSDNILKGKKAVHDNLIKANTAKYSELNNLYSTINSEDFKNNLKSEMSQLNNDISQHKTLSSNLQRKINNDSDITKLKEAYNYLKLNTKNGNSVSDIYKTVTSGASDLKESKLINKALKIKR